MYQLNVFSNVCKRCAQNKISYVFDKNNLRSSLPLNYLNINTLKTAYFNVFISNPRMYRYLFFHINIFIIYNDYTYKHKLIKKRITAKNCNRYLSINLNNCINPLDLKFFKIIIIEVCNINGLLYFSNTAGSKPTFMNFSFNQCKSSSYPKHRSYTLDDLINLYQPKTPVFNKRNNKSIVNATDTVPEISPKHTKVECPNNIDAPSIVKKNISQNLDKVIPKSNIIEKIMSKIKTEDFHLLLLKFLNKYIEVKVEFNGAKVLHGILEEVTNNCIILKDDNCHHVILIDSISIIYTPEKININDIIFNHKKFDISRILKYLKDNDVRISLNDSLMNISTVEVMNYCCSFVEVKDIKTKKIYFLNSDHIKTIESIPLK